MIEMCQKISFYMQTNYRSHSCVTQCDSSQQDTNDLLNGLLILWKVITYSKRMGKGNLKNDDDCEWRLLPSWYFILLLVLLFDTTWDVFSSIQLLPTIKVNSHCKVFSQQLGARISSRVQGKHVFLNSKLKSWKSNTVHKHRFYFRVIL